MSSGAASGGGDDDDGGGSAGEPMFREHKLCKTDSLASIAIRYGVTTRDIKRANGGVITDATLHARASLRIPRTSLAEGAPLPGGGGISGAAKPIATRQAAMTPALAKMREYYGTAKREDSPPPETSGRAGTDRDGGEAQRAFAGGAQVAKKIARSSSLGNLDQAAASSSSDPSTREKKGGGGKYGTALSGGAMPATAFQGRDRALMSPPKPPSGSGPPAASGAGRAADAFFSDAMKKFARAPGAPRLTGASLGLGLASGSSGNLRRTASGGGGGGFGVGFGGGAASNLPAGRKGKGD
jgi:LysM repeat protein